jgi:hypothetical protein
MAYGTIAVDTVSTSSGQILGAGNATGFKNRIINGAMQIDQRNAGASISNGSGGNAGYSVDRFAVYGSQVSKLTAQQNAGTVALPVGFTNYLGITSSSAYSVTSTDYFQCYQIIEGFNIADLAWGTASAKTVTLSFVVQSSLTGTFGGSIFNNAANRSYPFTYSIPTANTWTTVSVTIPGDTTGTWLTNNSGGMRIVFGLGAGSTYSGTAGAWAGSLYFSATGATSVVGTSGATFYITGVQLEVGSTATSFDVRDYGRELILCQRYYEVFYTASGSTTSLVASYNTATQYGINPTLKVTKRAAPTFGLLAGSSYTYFTPNGFALSLDNAYIYSSSGFWFISGVANTPACFFSAEL